MLILLTGALLWSIKELYLDRKKNLLDLPGPKPLPFLGNALLFAKPNEQFIPTVKYLMGVYGNVVRMHLGQRPNLIVACPDAYEKILSSNKQITKGRDYKFLWEWLGQGLLTSTGSKWHSRRKMLTPVFHFKILEDFSHVMSRQSIKLCDQIRKRCGSQSFNIFPLITHCALDIICETAMGEDINSQEESDTDYVRAVYRSSEIVFTRMRSPWLWSDPLFNLTRLGSEWKKAVKLMHGFTNEVIQKRKEEYSINNANDDDDDVDDLGRKKRMAFLDLLIKESKGGTVLSDEDIREEVDTFMFEGHDTTATNITFTFFLLASHTEVQEKCQAEMDSIFEGSDRTPTTADLARMKYLESCLKESLRLFQSVPVMSRTTGEEMTIKGVTIPANTNVMLINFMLHRDPTLFKNPNEFNPDRFSASNTEKQHAYAYVPFSAGPRNCIGQKFAMMEEKIVVSTVLRNFHLRTKMVMEEIPLLAEVILRPKDGIHVTATPR